MSRKERKKNMKRKIIMAILFGLVLPTLIITIGAVAEAGLVVASGISMAIYAIIIYVIEILVEEIY